MILIFKLEVVKGPELLTTLLSFSAPHLLLDLVVPGFLAALGPPFLPCPPVVLLDLSIHRDPAEISRVNAKTQAELVQ